VKRVVSKVISLVDFLGLVIADVISKNIFIMRRKKWEKN
jgi:hypothetical protein